MMTTLLTTTNGKDEFFPTPKNLALKMLSDINWEQIKTVLEPSAGKGNLVEFALRESHKHYKWRGKELDIDCIEIDPHLRQILKYNFSEEKRADLRERFSSLDRIYSPSRTKAQNKEYESLNNELRIFENTKMRIIHDDFLSYNGVKEYDLILMNPPFSNGDKHLIKAIELQKNGGEIVCLLNTETIRNPYTNTRQVLKNLLNQYGAKVQYIKDAFKEAERAADVEIAIIKISIPHEQERESEFWERMKKAASFENKQHEATEITVTDFLENLVTMYNVEVKASIKLIDEYNALKPYIYREFSKGKEKSVWSTTAILTLSVDDSLRECNVNKYLKRVRLKYWGALFSNKQLTGKLTSNLQDKYYKMIEKMADYDFTMFNIQTVLNDMNSEMIQGVKDTILSLFDKLSAQHSYYPECKNNIHLYNGWKTNKAHKVNHKVIIPTYGMFSNYSWSKETFDTSKAFEVLSDIEKIFNYLDGGLTKEVDLRRVLDCANNTGVKQNIECKYFTVSLFKKGTTHIKFKNQVLVDKLNIYAARNKAWLPPNYGKAHYCEMDAEEQAAVNEFQGAVEYEKVMADKGFYLFDATNSVLAIEQIECIQ